MIDIDGNEIHVGDVVRILSIDDDFLNNCLTDDERPHHVAMLNNDYIVDEIVENGTKASVSIEWQEPEGIAIGGLYLLPTEIRLIRKAPHENT